MVKRLAKLWKAAGRDLHIYAGVGLVAWSAWSLLGVVGLAAPGAILLYMGLWRMEG